MNMPVTRYRSPPAMLGVLVLLLLVCATASSASAETFTNRWTQAQIAVVQGEVIAVKGRPGKNWGIQPTGDGFVRLRSGPEAYLNLEKGLTVGPVKPGWWSAMWLLEDAGGGFVRIKNRWTGDYLNVEQGPLAVSPIQPGWLSAMWQVGTPQAQTAQPQQPVVQPTAAGNCTTLAKSGKATPEQACICHLLNPKALKQTAVSWGQGTNWTEPNAQALCVGTPDADLPIGCFEAAIALGAAWQQAIPWCRYDSSSCAYTVFNSKGNNWTEAVKQCHLGGVPAVSKGQQADETLCVTGAAAIRDPGTNLPLTMDQAEQVCGQRAVVEFPAQCLTAALARKLRTADAIALCRNTLVADAPTRCYDLGIATGAQAGEVIEVCRQQDDLITGQSTQMPWTYGLAMRDSCVRRGLGLEQKKANFDAAWAACKGLVLYAD
jgi:hypothetical protein